MTDENSPKQDLREFFNQVSAEGFTEVATIRTAGRWKDYKECCRKLIFLYAAFHPEGKISTFQRYKIDMTDHYATSVPRREDYDQKGLEVFLGEHGVELTPRTSLKEFIDRGFVI